MPNAIEFNVPDMSCQGCVKSITAAVQRVQAQAQVSADLVSKRVQIIGATNAASMKAAIEDAGFSVTTA